MKKAKPTNQPTIHFLSGRKTMMPDIVAHAHSPELGSLRRSIGLYIARPFLKKTKQKREKKKITLWHVVENAC